MADFLNRLAARALGAMPLVEPVIPTPFSSGPEQSAFLASESAFLPAHPSPETSAKASEGPSLTSSSREADPAFKTVVDRHAPPFEDVDATPHLPLSQPPRVFLPKTPPVVFAEHETVQPSLERAEVKTQHLPAAVLPPPGERRVADRTQARSPGQTPVAEPLPAPRLAPHAEPTRRQASQRAESSQAFGPAPPTVHVSIGRIEVRAEITSPAPAQRAQRPRPSTLSLDQFLKEAGGGTR